MSFHLNGKWLNWPPTELAPLNWLGLSSASLVPPPLAIPWLIGGSDQVEAGGQKWPPVEGAFENSL